MLEALLTLMVLAAGGGAAEAIQPGSEYYALELAFEQAALQGAQSPDQALTLALSYGDERLAEAESLNALGDSSNTQLALAYYGLSLAPVADVMASSDGMDDDAVIAELDFKLNEQGDRIAKIKDEQGDDTDGDGQEDEGEAEGDGENSACTRPDHPVGQRIADRFGLSYEQVMAWVCATDDTHHSFGEIMVAAKIAQKAGISIDEVFALRAEGHGWGQLKKDLGVTGKGGEKGNKYGNGNAGEADGDNGNKNGNGNSGGTDDGGTDDKDKGNKNGNGNGGGDDDAGEDDGETDDGDEQGEDEDGDGILDDVDNCDDVSNPDQLDSDGDGEGDACAEDEDDQGEDESGTTDDGATTGGTTDG